MARKEGGSNMLDSSDFLPSPTVLPAQPGWTIIFIDADDTLDDVRIRPGEPVIAWRFNTDFWAFPLIAGEQFSHQQDYVLRTPDGLFITTDGAYHNHLTDAYQALRPNGQR